MAQSPSHQFGQIVGNVLEVGILRLLEKFARERELYLDRKGRRPSRRGMKCSWIDLHGNIHDLDFVLERGGSPDKAGMPVAFVESAWRRYTKHSRNKAQEIQGAVEPLAETYRNSAPFKGAILAGVFTAGALAQLRSLGFTVLHIPYDSVVTVFRRSGIDASSDEETPDEVFQKKIDAYQRLTDARKARLASALIQAHKAEVDTFLNSLSDAVSRQIDRIIILALHGKAREVMTVDDAIRFIEGYDDNARMPVERYEIEIRYNNGDAIKASFKDKAAAIGFLRNYQPASPNVKQPP